MAELSRRYIVMQMATEGPFDLRDPDVPFVLKPWKDPAALKALEAYRDHCYPELAAEITAWIAAIGGGPAIRGTVGVRNEVHLASRAPAPSARPGQPARAGAPPAPVSPRGARERPAKAPRRGGRAVRGASGREEEGAAPPVTLPSTPPRRRTPALARGRLREAPCHRREADGRDPDSIGGFAMPIDPGGAVTRLLSSRDSHRAVPPFTETAPDVTIDEAYALQGALEGALARRGERVIGWKAGFTNPAVQQSFGAAEPVAGFMLGSGVFADGDAIPVARFARARRRGRGGLPPAVGPRRSGRHPGRGRCSRSRGRCPPSS